MDTLKNSCVVGLVAAWFSVAGAQELSQDPIGDARRAIQQDADFDSARLILEAFESYALEAAPTVTPEALAEMSFLLGVMEFYLNQDEAAARLRWSWTLQIIEDFEWDDELVGGAGKEVFEAVRRGVKSSETFVPVETSDQYSRPVFVDGRRMDPGAELYPGQHLIQARCSDGIIRGVYAYLSEAGGLLCPCPLDSCVAEDSESTGPQANTERGEIGVSLFWGDWYSRGEGFSGLPGIGASMRLNPTLQLDADVGAYFATARETRTDGGFVRLAASYVRASGSWDLLAGLQVNLLVANDIYTLKNGSQVESPYTGVLAGVHLGAAYTMAGSHQVGVRLGYTPILLEGDILVYANTTSSVYFRYSL